MTARRTTKQAGTLRKPGRIGRPRELKNAVQSHVTLESSQREKFIALGASRWLRAQIDAALDPEGYATDTDEA